jgi:SAM-dependent methyltransferase
MTGDEQRLAVLFDQLACVYHEEIGRRQSYWPLVRAALRSVGDGAVLDVGCGPGHLTAELPATVAVYGIDISAEMIAAAAAARPAGVYEVRSFNAPLPEGWPRFDVIVAVGCFEFCGDLVGTLRRFRDALAPGGTILVTMVEDRMDGLGPELAIPTADGPVDIRQHSFVAMARAIGDAALVPLTYTYTPGWKTSEGEQVYYALWTLGART